MWVVKVSLATIAAHGVILVMAPAILPLLGQVHLRWEHALRLLETVSPTFVGFVAMAAVYAVKTPLPETPQLAPEQVRLMSTLLQGGIAVFVAVDIASLTAFVVSNRPGAAEGGLSFDGLSHILAASLSVLSATTSGSMFGAAGSGRQGCPGLL